MKGRKRTKMPEDEPEITKELKRGKENEMEENDSSIEEIVLKNGLFSTKYPDISHGFIIKIPCKTFIEESLELPEIDEKDPKTFKMEREFEFEIDQGSILLKLGFRAQKLKEILRKKRTGLVKRKRSYQCLLSTEAISKNQTKKFRKSICLIFKMYTEDSKTFDTKHIYITLNKGPKIVKITNIMLFPSKDHEFIINGSADLSSFHQKHSPKYAGLVNNGMTCYMNSLLQTLFQIKEIPRCLFNLPYSEFKDREDVGNWKWIFAFQCMYYHLLSVKNKSAETRMLTDAFGWNTAEVFTQQDVQEFSCLLLDSFEKKCEISDSENFVQRLFRGEIENYIQCCDVDYRSSRKEFFYDVQLPIKDKSNIYESLEAYTEEEDLKDDNKYDAGEEHGKQDAVKGLKFTQLPPVLLLHLRRFEYDFNLDRNVKITTRHELQESINLRDYVKGDTGEDLDYELFGILTHQGTTAGAGHYITFIRPEMKEWYKFNDEYVSQVSLDYVKKYAEGGTVQKLKVDSKTREIKYAESSSNSTAYMLVYIQKSKVKEILRPIEENDIPENVRKSVEEQIRANEKEEFFEDNLEILCTSFPLIQGQNGLGCLVEERAEWDESPLEEFREAEDKRISVVVKKNETLEEFLDRIESETGLKRESYGLWSYDYDKKWLKNLLSNVNYKARKTRKMETMFKSEIKKSRIPIVLILPFNRNLRIFREITDGTIIEEREFSEYLKANNQVWNKTEEEKEILVDGDLLKNLKGYKSSLILLKEFDSGTNEVVLKNFGFFSKSDSIQEIYEKFEIDTKLPVFVEKIGSQNTKIELSEETLEDGKQIKEIFANVSILVKINKAEDIDKVQEMYEEVANRALIQVENSNDNTQKTIFSDLRKSTSTFFREISEQVFKNQVKASKLAIECTYDDEPLEIQKNNTDMKNVEDIISESNVIKVGTSQFEASQLSENFATKFTFVQLNGEVRETQETQLVKREATCQEVIDKISEIFEDEIEQDLTSIEGSNVRFKLEDDNEETNLLEITGVEGLILNYKEFPHRPIMAEDSEYLNEAESQKIIFLNTLRMKNMDNTSSVKLLVNMTYRVSKIIAKPFIFEASRELSNDGLALVLRRMMFLRNPGSMTDKLDDVLTEENIENDCKIYLIKFDKKMKVKKQNLETLKDKADWDDVYDDNQDNFEFLKVKMEYTPGYSRHAQLKIE